VWKRYTPYVSGPFYCFSQVEEVPVLLTTTDFPSQDRKEWVGVVLNMRLTFLCS
jgi:hypothetical protein